MKKIFSWLTRIISVVLVMAIFVPIVSAEEIVKSIRKDIILASAFPLDLVKIDQVPCDHSDPCACFDDAYPNDEESPKTDESDELLGSELSEEIETVEPSLDVEDTSFEEPNSYNVQFLLKSDFLSYTSYAVEVLDWKNNDHLLSEVFDREQYAYLSDLDFDKTYTIYLRIYNEDHIRSYEGSFVSSAGQTQITVQAGELDTKPNLESLIKTEDDSEDLNLSAEQYGQILASLDLPSVIEEDAAKSAQHVERLNEYKDRYDAIGYRNVDGSKTVYLFSSPVRYKDKNGVIRDAEVSLQTAPQAYRNSGFSHFNDFGELETYFADQLSDDKGIKIVKSDLELEFGIVLEPQKKGLLDTVLDAVGGLVLQKDNTATVKQEKKSQRLNYQKAYKSRFSVNSEPTINGAKQDVVFDSIPNSNTIQFWLSSSGLQALENEASSAVDFFDYSGKHVFTFGFAELKDSFTGENEENHVHFSIANSVHILSQTNNRVLIEIELNSEMLNSPITQYPVTASVYASYATPDRPVIDKVMEENVDDTVSTEQPSSEIKADTVPMMLMASPPTTVNYTYFQDRTVYNNGSTEPYNSPYLIVGQNGTYYDSISCTYKPREGISFMKYDLCNFTSIDPASIQKADLILHEGSGNSGGVTIDLKRVTANWNDTGLSSAYLNYIDSYYAGNACKYMSTSASALEQTFDVTRMATDHLISQKGLSGGISNYGFALRSYSTATRKDFFSANHSTLSYRPKLVINYRDIPTLSELGLSTSKAYWIRRKGTNGYLTTEGWKSTSNVKVTNSSANLNSFSETESLMKDNMYWKLQYDSATGDFKIIPMNSPDMQLDVISSVNANLENVGIYSQGNYTSSKWRIEKKGTSGGINYYEILSRLAYYQKGLDVTGTNVDIYDISYINQWEFIEVRCPTYYGYSGYAIGHALDSVKQSGYNRYKCLSCQSVFKSPEEQDIDKLPTREFATMIGLQKAYITKVIEGDMKKADATMRIINHIRSKFGSGYDFRNRSGTFNANYNYLYNSSNYDFYICLYNNDQTDSIFGSQMLNLMSFIPGYGLLCSGLLLFEDYIDNGSISFIDALFLVAGVGSFTLSSRLPALAAKAIDTVDNIGTAWGVAQILTGGGQSFTNNYSVSVEYTNNCETKWIYGEYRFNYRNSIYIKKEKLTEGSGNVNAHYNYSKFSYNPISSSGNYYWMDIVSGNYVPNGI